MLKAPAGVTSGLHESFGPVMRCIFCLNDRPPGNEPVFPRAIGGTLRINRVCDEVLEGTRSSNSMLGSVVDALLTDHPFIAVHRERLNLPGYSGKVPNAVKMLLGQGGVLATDSTQKVRLVKNGVTGKLEPQLLYHKKSELLPEGSTRYGITIDARGGFDEVKRLLIREVRRAKQGNPGATVPTNAEIDAVARKCVENVKEIEAPTVEYKLQIDVAKFRRAIFKIAYELAFTWLGEP